MLVGEGAHHSRSDVQIVALMKSPDARASSVTISSHH